MGPKHSEHLRRRRPSRGQGTRTPLDHPAGPARTQLLARECQEGHVPVQVLVEVDAQETQPLFFYFLKIKKLIYFWLHRVFVAAHGLSLVAASGGHASLR